MLAWLMLSLAADFRESVSAVARLSRRAGGATAR
jgi:hypothetical protein